MNEAQEIFEMLLYNQSQERVTQIRMLEMILDVLERPDIKLAKEMLEIMIESAKKHDKDSL